MLLGLLRVPTMKVLILANVSLDMLVMVLPVQVSHYKQLKPALNAERLLRGPK